MSGRPLIVDADTTLFGRTQTLQAIFAILKDNPLIAIKICASSLRGSSYFGDQRWSEAIDLSTLPLDERVVSIARAAAERGRPVFFCMSRASPLSGALAKRFPFIEGVIAGNSTNPLAGPARATALAEKFFDGFDYVGRSDIDLPVWRQSRTAILVDATATLQRRASVVASDIEILPAKPWGRALVRALRQRQWVKNILVFAPIILGGSLNNVAALAATFAAFFAMSLVASSTYLINDMLDARDDRKHWSKCNRPVATGELPLDKALWAAAAGLGSGFAIAALISQSALACLCVYVLMTLSYSLYLKRVPLMDGLVLAALYTLRFALGIAASGVYTSPWLFVVSMFVFTSLCFAKRYTELNRIAEVGRLEIHGRGYKREDLPLVLALGIAAGVSAVIVVVFYILDDAFRRTFHGNPLWLWSFPLLLFVSNCRIWLVTVRGEMSDDPVDFALRDRASQLIFAALLVCFAFAWFG
ncbi:MAG: UbiA family prenyltransferase [Hyphomicrobiaceae bacterium]